MTTSFEDLAKVLKGIRPKHTQKLIGIDGGGGVGKTTFAKHVSDALPESEIIHLDDFYKERSKRVKGTGYEVNPNYDWGRFDREILAPLTLGKPIVYQAYNWNTDAFEGPVSVTPDATIIIEGMYATQPAFKDVYDYTIWIHAEDDVRLDRALTRDGEHMRPYWENEWIPIEKNYMKVHNPSSQADLVVRGHATDFTGGYFEEVKE